MSFSPLRYFAKSNASSLIKVSTVQFLKITDQTRPFLLLCCAERRGRVQANSLCWSISSSFIVCARAGRQSATQLVYAGYMLTISFLLIELFEKRSIVERFGFQRKNVLGLTFAVCLGFILVCS